jgi:hypothetical protein
VAVVGGAFVLVGVVEVVEAGAEGEGVASGDEAGEVAEGFGEAIGEGEGAGTRHEWRAM